MKDPISVNEASSIIGIGSCMVRVYCRRGSFATARLIGRDWIIEREEVMSFRPTKKGPRRKEKAIAIAKTINVT